MIARRPASGLRGWPDLSARTSFADHTYGQRNGSKASDQCQSQSGAARMESPTAPAVRDETVRRFATAHVSGDRSPLNPTYNKYEQRFGNGHAEIVDYLIVEGDRANPTTLPAGAS